MIYESLRNLKNLTACAYYCISMHSMLSTPVTSQVVSEPVFDKVNHRIYTI